MSTIIEVAFLFVCFPRGGKILVVTTSHDLNYNFKLLLDTFPNLD